MQGEKRQMKLPLDDAHVLEVTVILRCSCGQSWESTSEAGAFDLWIGHDHESAVVP